MNSYLRPYQEVSHLCYNTQLELASLVEWIDHISKELPQDRPFESRNWLKSETSNVKTGVETEGIYTYHSCTGRESVKIQVLDTFQNFVSHARVDLHERVINLIKVE